MKHKTDNNSTRVDNSIAEACTSLKKKKKTKKLKTLT